MLRPAPLSKLPPSPTLTDDTGPPCTCPQAATLGPCCSFTQQRLCHDVTTSRRQLWSQTDQAAIHTLPTSHLQPGESPSPLCCLNPKLLIKACAVQGYREGLKEQGRHRARCL